MSDPDFYENVTSMAAVTVIPEISNPCFVFSIGTHDNKVIYVDLGGSDLQAAARAHAIVAVVSAAFISKSKLKVFLNTSSDAQMIADWVQL